MDGIAAAVKQQNTQAVNQNIENTNFRTNEAQLQSQRQDVVKQIQQDSAEVKIESESDAQDLVDQLNRALDPFNTSLKFGFDNRDDVFFVSVIETESNRMLRRWPAEQAMQFLPKMQEVTGLLFDSKG